MERSDSGTGWGKSLALKDAPSCCLRTSAIRSSYELINSFLSWVVSLARLEAETAESSLVTFLRFWTRVPW